MLKATKLKLLAIAALFLAVAIPVAVMAMEVRPLVIDLNARGGRGMASSFQVRNTFTTPLPVEIRIQELSFDERGLIASNRPTEDLVVFPTQAVIAPGRTQNFRVQYVGDPELARSKHYYATVAQLPVQLAEGQSGIQILYNFQVLVSVAARNASPDIQVVAAERGQNEQGRPVIFLTVENSAATYGYLSEGRLRLIERNAAGEEVARRTWAPPEMLQAVGIGIVGPGQRRRVAILAEVNPATTQITGEFEYAVRR